MFIRNCHASVTRDYKNAAFQEYTALLSSLVAPIPDVMAFCTAVVLPVAVSTASAALFGPDTLDLSPPQAVRLNSSVPDVGEEPSHGVATILVWGGSTSVGCAAIQLARAAGLRVITTASKQNFGLCKAIGAQQVFDRESGSVVDEIVAALRGRVLVGALNAVGTPSTLQACIDIIVSTESKKIVATTLPAEEAVDQKGVKVIFCKCNKPSMATTLPFATIYPGHAILEDYVPHIRSTSITDC